MVLILDNSNTSVPISFKSHKSCGVTSYVLSAKVIGFSDRFDYAMAIRSKIDHALQQPVPMHLMTDSKSLFDIISKGSRASEQRIILDIPGTRQTY